MRYKVLRTQEFCDWLKGETLKAQVQVEKRIANIEIEGRFGLYKDLEDDLFELKWSNGRRVYYACLQGQNVMLLLGDNKNGQDYDINQAKKILNKYTRYEE
jgi:putative addiction module killer protein